MFAEAFARKVTQLCSELSKTYMTCSPGQYVLRGAGMWLAVTLKKGRPHSCISASPKQLEPMASTEQEQGEETDTDHGDMLLRSLSLAEVRGLSIQALPLNWGSTE